MSFNCKATINWVLINRWGIPCCAVYNQFRSSSNSRLMVIRCGFFLFDIMSGVTWFWRTLNVYKNTLNISHFVKNDFPQQGVMHHIFRDESTQLLKLESTFLNDFGSKRFNSDNKSVVVRSCKVSFWGLKPSSLTKASVRVHF